MNDNKLFHDAIKLALNAQNNDDVELGLGAAYGLYKNMDAHDAAMAVIPLSTAMQLTTGWTLRDYEEVARAKGT